MNDIFEKNNDGKIAWGWVIVFCLFISYIIWIILVLSGHAPIFDFYEEYGFFEFDTLLGGIIVSLVSFIIMISTLLLMSLIITLFFIAAYETFKSGRYGIKYVKEKIKKNKAEKSKDTKTDTNRKMGQTQRNL